MHEHLYLGNLAALQMAHWQCESRYTLCKHTHRHAHLTMLQFIVCLLLMAALVKFCQLAHAKHCGKCGWQFSALIKSQIQAVIAKCSPVPTCPISVSPSLYLSLYLYLCVLLARPFEVVCLLQCMSFGGVESNPHYFSLKFINMLCLAFNILLVLSPPAPLPPAATQILQLKCLWRCFPPSVTFVLFPLIVIIWPSDSIKSNGKMLLSN